MTRTLSKLFASSSVLPSENAATQVGNLARVIGNSVFNKTDLPPQSHRDWAVQDMVSALTWDARHSELPITDGTPLANYIEIMGDIVGHDISTRDGYIAFLKAWDKIHQDLLKAQKEDRCVYRSHKLNGLYILRQASKLYAAQSWKAKEEACAA